VEVSTVPHTPAHAQSRQMSRGPTTSDITVFFFFSAVSFQFFKLLQFFKILAL
jgi:hypothetical protein